MLLILACLDWCPLGLLPQCTEDLRYRFLTIYERRPDIRTVSPSRVPTTPEPRFSALHRSLLQSHAEAPSGQVSAARASLCA